MARTKGSKNKRDRTKKAPTPKKTPKKTPKVVPMPGQAERSNAQQTLDIIDDLFISSGALRLVQKEKRAQILNMFVYLDNELGRLAEFDKRKEEEDVKSA